MIICTKDLISKVSKVMLAISIACIQSFANAAYQYFPGKYSIQLEATDTSESYPVNLWFNVGSTGNIENGQIDYPIYSCSAKIISVPNDNILNSNIILFHEKMLPGKDMCDESEYRLVINDSYGLSPHNSAYFNFIVFDDSQKIVIDIIKYTFEPTRFGSERLLDNFGSVEDILMSRDSNLIRKYIKIIEDKDLQKLFSERLFSLITIEEDQYNNTLKINKEEVYLSYIAMYPGSKYIKIAKINIESILLDRRISLNRNENTVDGFYSAYILSGSDNDIYSMLGLMKSASQIELFVREHIKLESNHIIEKRLIAFYRKSGVFSDYIKAYNLSRSKFDIQSAHKLAKTIQEKKIIERLIVEKIGVEGIFDVNITQTSIGLKDHLESGLFFTGKSMILKEFTYDVVINPKDNSPIEIKYNDYLINMDFTLTIDVSPSSVSDNFSTRMNFKNTFTLSSSNNWRDMYTIKENVPIAGKIKGFWPNNPVGNQYTVKEFTTTGVTLNYNIH
jgi:hypothetical protein